MKNTDRVPHNGGKKRRSSQAKTGKVKAAVLESEPTMQVVFFKPGADFHAGPECHVAAQIEMPARLFEKVKASASQATTDYYGVKQRSIRYDWVTEFMDDFQGLDFARGEACGLLALGVHMMRLLAKDAAGLKLVDTYAGLVAAADHKMAVAVNSIHQDVFNIEPRIEDHYRTYDQIAAVEGGAA